MRRAVTVIGIGDDGCVGLSARAFNAVAAATVLVGGERHHAFFPDFGGERLTWRGGMAAVLDKVAAMSADHSICIVASGDPLFFGIGGQVVDRLGAEHVEIVPVPSSVQWAFARLGVPWQDAAFLSLHGRPCEGLAARLRRLAKAAVLTDPDNTPARIAAHLIEYGAGDLIADVGENLGGAGERVRRFTLPELAAATDIGNLNVVVLSRRDPAWRPPPLVPFLPEEAFARRMPKAGLITKREVRVLSLAALGLRADSVVWDIGAGSGSVAIEAALIAPEGRVFAIEVDPEGVALCRDNARAHGADNVHVVEGRAPAALAGLDAPDAVFVGGSKGAMDDLVETSLDRLRPGGRLVVNAITLDNVAECYRALKARQLTPELMVVNVARGAPLAHYLRYEAQNPVHIFAVEKP